MIFRHLVFDGVYLIELEKIEDDRGFFARAWDKKLFEENNLNPNLEQCNISFNKKKGTIRGLHYQKYPFEEAKTVRCTKGQVFEVMVDLRKNSKTYLKWHGERLSEDDYKILFIPEGFALGFQTLEENTELFYQMSKKYAPDSARGIKWDDPKLKIEWPMNPTVISERDNCFEYM